MREVLIVNLTRLGDLVQTTPVMIGLKEAYPDVQITLLVNKSFAEICNYIPYIDKLYLFDKSGFENAKYSMVKNFRYLEGLLDEVNRVEYDLAINFTHSMASALLTSMIRAKEVRGFSVDAEGHSLIRHQWIRYFFNVVRGRGYNPYHLCDIYAKAGGAIPTKKGLHLEVPEEAEERVQAVLNENGISNNDLLIGLQLGASQDNRRWPISSFARLADRLVDAFGAKICLIGAASEAHIGMEFEELAKTRPLNLIGKTNLGDLAALLKRCSLLVSNDTGPLHIATAVGTKVIGIFLATAHFKETGPYGEDHYVVEADIPCSPCGFQVECKEMVCKVAIRVDNLFELAKMVIGKNPVLIIEDSLLWKDVQVYRSYFAEDGLLDYNPIIKCSLKKETLLSYLYRKTWLKILDKNEDFVIEAAYQYLANKIDSCYSPQTLVEVVDSLKGEFATFIRLKELAEEAFRRVSMVAEESKKKSLDVRKVKELWEGVPDIDKEIEALGYVHPSLYPIILLFKYGREALESKDLTFLSDETCNLYRDIKDHVSIIVHFIERLTSSYGLYEKENSGIE